MVLLDNTENSSEKVIPQIAKISGYKVSDLPFYKADVRNPSDLKKVFEDCQKKNRKIEAVIHFAALKAAGESVHYPLEYYQTNFVGTLNILQVMKQFECKKIIFSSSACVYGNGNQICKEEDPTETLNPYGSTKLFSEKMLQEFCNSKTGKSKITN